MSHGQTTSPCRVCGKHESDGQEHMAGICHGCLYKIGILVLIVMISVSYIVWFGVI